MEASEKGIPAPSEIPCSFENGIKLSNSKVGVSRPQGIVHHAERRDESLIWVKAGRGWGTSLCSSILLSTGAVVMAITHSFDNPAAVRAAHHRIAARAAKAV